MTGRHIPAADLAGTPGPASMSLEFTAFRELHHPRYLSYARVWFPDPASAADVVELAFKALATVWPEILGSPNPAAAAWQILRGTVAERIAPPGTSTPRTAADEDLAILHYVVGLATPEIADVMGADTASVASQLRHALRRETADW
ncbi:hypothetical protein [Kitasatospora sp. MAP5-34]|uniref:RNA polymerase sigma factor n=1 Tax=Kitasatospora sp. MAP5-34 TaxID=3035102 RepID=UPI002473E723|nr:hypothetical protein [Kitasatospora sp. MAP5-34]MDH6577136.1 DNA-directed RNA polymerase specialized sigma24 family protein [Kitasatospora sp. MAP5-34]